MAGKNYSSGFSIIELMVSLGLITMIFGGIFFSYSSILSVLSNAEIRTSAVSALNRQVEIVRNMPYDQVGVQGGFPAGVIPYLQNVAVGRSDFVLKTTVRNIDDPYDGTLGGTPNDTAPADYKLVELEVSCPRCSQFIPLSITTTVAPKNLESTGNNGSMFVKVFDAQGQAIPGAQVQVVNTAISPTIDINDTTSNNGILQLVGLPTSTQNYQITVSSTGYTTDRTYPPGNPSNPNPVNPNATVAAGTLTIISLSIDKVATLNISSTDAMCLPTANLGFSMGGTKLIGTSPDIFKFSTTSQTDANGYRTIGNLEWDSYSYNVLGGRYLRGASYLSPIEIDPGSVINLHLVTVPPAPNGLLVTAKSSTGGDLPGASVELTKTGFSKTLLTGRETIYDTNWANNNYSGQTGGIDADSSPGTIKLKEIASSTYSTTTEDFLDSKTFDIGSNYSVFYALNWTPASQPPESDPDALRFQIATNNDNAVWNFVGPDGTASTYYTTPGQAIYSGHTNHRYLRYRARMLTRDQNHTPSVDDVTIDFNSVCVPPSQVLFTNLSAGTYNLAVSLPGYTTATGTVSVASGFQQTQITLTP
jgi:hypothetical protein